MSIDANAPRYRFLRWWAGHDLPRAIELLRRAQVFDNALWRDAGDGYRRGRWHGYRVRLDLSHHHQRGAYFYGRMCETNVQLVVRTALHAGDIYLDAGAHVGLTTLLGAWRVGPEGRVLSFEPNPTVYERLRWHVETNRLRHISTFPFALSDREETSTLRVPTTGNTGAATLGELVPRQQGPGVVEHQAQLRAADDVLAGIDLPERPMLVKLDVEGHELRLLQGMGETLRTRRPAVLLECNTEMLPQNGSSVGELFEFLQDLGYEAFGTGAAWHRWRRRFDLLLRAHPRDWRPRRTADILFLIPGGVHWERLSRWHGCSRAYAAVHAEPVLSGA